MALPYMAKPDTEKPYVVISLTAYIRYGFQIGLRITIEYQLGIRYGGVVDQIVQFRPLIHIVSNLILDGNGINGYHTAIAEFQFHAYGIEVEFARCKL